MTDVQQPVKTNLDGTPSKTSAGRPTKLTKELVDIIGSMVEKGLSAERVSYVLGVKKRTYVRWLDKSRSPKVRGIYGYLRQVVDEAEQRCEAALVEAIRERALLPYEDVVSEVVELPDGSQRKKVTRRMLPPDMATAKWFLTRRFPDRWADRAKIEHSGSIEGASTNIVLKFKDPESLDEKIDEHQKLLGIPDAPKIDESGDVNPIPE